jgi:hypothetical protein
MSLQDVRRAYYRATARDEARNGCQWPLIGGLAIDEHEGTVTGGFSTPTVLARFSRDSLDRVRLRLINYG